LDFWLQERVAQPMTERTRFETVTLRNDYDVLAPDTSEIRLLTRLARGSMAHGTLPPGGTSLAVVHRTVEEIWYVLSGRAEFWRQQGVQESVVELGAGTALTLPVGTRFQFRTTGDEPFRFIMCTMPPWPGDGEAIRVPDYWPVAIAADGAI
jgi:mannose-6-phosphate isomerase-like protein (cupin superfamily)